MSSYWDALARAALDLPATAGPRPRSRFEPDRSEVDVADAELADEPFGGLAPAPSGPPQAPIQPSAALPVEVPGPPIDRTFGVQHAEQRPIPGTPQPAEVAALVVSAQPVVTATTTPAPEVPPPLPATAQPIQRVEVHHTEAEASVAAAVPAPGAAGTDVPAEPTGPRDDRPPAPPRAETQSPDEETAPANPPVPIVTVAEPLVQAPAPVEHSPSGEPPPLVIEIERVDIKIEHEAAPATSVPPRRPIDSGAVPSLSDYLARRTEGRA